MDITDTINELRKLNQPVPKPVRLPTTDEVRATELALDISFHPDYRLFLLEAGDVVYGTIEPCTLTVEDAHTDLVRVASEAWKEIGVPKDLIPICEDNGDYYCMNTSGEVVFWTHNGATTDRWQNLANWIMQVWIKR